MQRTVAHWTAILGHLPNTIAGSNLFVRLFDATHNEAGDTVVHIAPVSDADRAMIESAEATIVVQRIARGVQE